MVFVDDTLHSKIGASSMYRWSACPASVSLCEMAGPQASSVYAMEGTLAHEVAARKLQTGKWPDPKELGLTASKLKAMKKPIRIYLDYIDGLDKKDSEILIEHSFDMDMVFANAFGTADCVHYNYKEKHLRVIDYKHGAGLVVEVEGNPQLKYYTLGALLTLGFPTKTIETVVVQPRAYHDKGPVRSTFSTSYELLEFEEFLVKSAIATTKRNAPVIAGPHCFFCNAIDICPKSKQAKAEKQKVSTAPRNKTDAKDEFTPIPKGSGFVSPDEYFSF